ncbi:hypothetical protein QQF64_017924, partial [Cirrhinus molitorella]
MDTSISEVEEGLPMSYSGTLSIRRSEGTLISALSARLRPNPVFASRLSRITVPESKGMVTDQRKGKTYACEDAPTRSDNSTGFPMTSPWCNPHGEIER